MTGDRDLIGVVETAYRLHPSDDEWLEALATEVRSLLDAGLGLAAFFFDARDTRKLRFSKPLVLGAAPAASLALSAALRLLPSRMVGQAFGTPMWMATASQVFGLGEALKNHFLVRRFGHPFGFHDMVGFKVHDPTGEGVMMLAALPKIRAVPARETALWGMCAAHVGAALRLRRTLSSDTSFAPFDGGEAVLEPNGNLAHAQVPAQARNAREALREAVLSRERARGSMRRTAPLDALELWQALIAGRWSLVEHFDTDGHRYLVARRNDPSVHDPRGLSLRERQVVAYAALGHSGKLIGYELGLSPSTVWKHLTSAMKKLGVQTRADLMQVVGARPVAT